MSQIDEETKAGAEIEKKIQDEKDKEERPAQMENGSDGEQGVNVEEKKEEGGGEVLNLTNNKVGEDDKDERGVQGRRRIKRR